MLHFVDKFRYRWDQLNRRAQITKFLGAVDGCRPFSVSLAGAVCKNLGLEKGKKETNFPLGANLEGVPHSTYIPSSLSLGMFLMPSESRGGGEGSNVITGERFVCFWLARADIPLGLFIRGLRSGSNAILGGHLFWHCGRKKPSLASVPISPWAFTPCDLAGRRS